MVKHLIGCVVIIALSGNSFFINAQQFKQFSGKPEKFTSEINLFLGSTDEPVLKKTVHDFAVNWDSLIFSVQEKENILLYSRCFIEKKGRANPDFYNFLNTLNLFLVKGHPRESFGQWLNALTGICNNPKTSILVINRLIGNTSALLAKNVIYQSPSIIWKPTSNNYLYKFDSTLHLVFENTDLVCYSRHDSIKITGTSGEVLPTKLHWNGRKGKITWERAGYSSDSVSASLTNYNIDLTKSSYEADSVSFTYKAYFSTPLFGHFEDNVTFIKKPSLATYPVFDSYKKQFVIRNLYPNVNYEGGYSMQGAKLIGKGSIEKPARLDFYRKDTLRLKAASQFFIFRPERIIGTDAMVSIYLDQDSIYHGDVQFTYTTKNKEISLVKSENYTAQSPYLDSYHKIDMNFEQLRWRIDEPIILITTNPGSSIGKASFESINFFNNQEYSDLQYYDEINPLVALKHYADYIDTNKFSAIEFSSYLKKPIDNIHTLLFPLAVKGFIFYNSLSETVELKKRLYNFISANGGKIDYDVLKFISTTNAPLENASIDLRNNDLKINGMSRVFVSDSQNVIIYPKDENILMKHNRSFQFDGTVVAGLFTFYGKNFFFDYDKFKIVLKNVDSVRIKVITGYDNFAKPIYEDVKNIVQDVTGEVFIDSSVNKSGLHKYPIYPVFKSYENSYVYYDNPSVYNGVYKRNRDFYFQIFPYVIDSLNTFKKENMEFKGKFFSAKIFPPISEELKLQPDYSLGFKHLTPPEGLPLYEGKGLFTNNIILSNLGLKGDGTINYLSMNIKSNEIYFFPDSMNTIAPEFTLQAVATGTEYPQASGQNLKIHWLPYSDQMQISNLDKPMHIINSETTLNGKMVMGPNGLTGSGTMEMSNAVASSKLFKYGYSTINSDTASFLLRNLHKEGFSVLTSNLKAHIDFSNRSGTFTENDDTTLTKFPENKYIAKIDEFRWKMDKKELELISQHQQEASKKGENYGFKDEILSGTVYTSTKPDQDSLSFVSPQVIFDYENDILNANRVKYIDIADARIFPDMKKITIEKDAEILPLVNSKILANTETRFHNFYQATTKIMNRDNYVAKGKYDYIDENNKPLTINFSNISVDTTIQTIASGNIVEPDNFTLSPDFMYQGKVNLYSNEKLLTFDGYVHIIDTCPNYRKSWLKFESQIDPVNVSIPVGQKLVELNGKPIVFGTLITTDSIHIYSSFFGLRKNYNDSLLLTSDGYLQFNKDSATYSVASLEKLKAPQLSEPLVAINRNTCVHHDEGKMKLGIELGQFKISAAGNIDHDLNKNLVKLRLMMSLDFFMLDKSMESMGKMVDSLTSSRTPIDMASPNYKKNLGNLIEEDKLKKYFDELALQGKGGYLPDALNKSIFLNDVTLFWDDNSNSYRSLGKIGLGYINKHKINKYVDGYVEIWRKRTGDIFDLYLKIDERTYYYFGYTRGTMQVLSSDDKGFNDPIRILKDSERNLKTHHNQTPYSFLVSTARKMGMVYNRWMSLKEPNKQQQMQEEQPQEEKPSEEKSKEMPKENNQNVDPGK